MSDHYKTLGVDRDATVADIKKAYRKLAREHHPDHGGDPAQFRKISEAYKVLSSSKLRTAYDESYVDGAGVLDEVTAWLREYVSFSSEHAAVTVALWAAHTHLVSSFDSTPRLALVSPEKQCGKSRVLELLQLLCAGAETLSSASPAYLFRRIDAGQVTILLDEADAIWTRKADETAEALRSIVDAGYRKSATIGRVQMTGQTAMTLQFRVYAPVAAAAIGDLPDTIMDRAAVIRMRRRPPDQQVRQYRERITRPEGAELRDRLADWCAQVEDTIGDNWPELPAGVTDRKADIWEPLIVIADLAGGGWPELARKACIALVAGAADDTQTVGIRLLSDLRDIFGDEDALWTETILGKLNALEEAPWGAWYGEPLQARDLAKLLNPYGVTSEQVKLGGKNRRGYTRQALWASWHSYLSKPGPGSATGATSATALIRQVAEVADVADDEGNLEKQ